MRRSARVDSNQAAIVAALRAAGATVQPLHTIGKGCPDLLVGYHAINLLFEVKDGSLPPSRKMLTNDEAQWFGTWNGQAQIIESVDEALAALVAAYPTKRKTYRREPHQ